jgi:hypothetical protein
MRIARLCAVVAGALAVLIVMALDVVAAPLGTVAAIQRDGSLKIGGRELRCGQVRNVLDQRLPSEGAAGPGVLVINPRLIARMPEIVRLFVFHHECGHHNIGASELKADCWAVEAGVREGWLDRNGLKLVCRSFGNAPETPSHPSGRRRCHNVDACYTRAVAKFAKSSPPAGATAAASQPAPAAPKLIAGPKLIGSGILHSFHGPSGGTSGDAPPSALP